MRCYICDVELTENEIQIGEDGKAEPCTTCLDIIMATAYSDGFEPDTNNTQHDHNSLLEMEIDENETQDI